MNVLANKTSPAIWQIWLSSLGLWLVVTLILLCVTVGLVASFVMWFAVTPIHALVEAMRRLKKPDSVK